MPKYVYECKNANCENAHEEIERLVVSFEERDDQDCMSCDYPLTRLYRFKGTVWSPTKNGGHS